MSDTNKHIKKFFNKRLSQISQNLKKQFGRKWHEQFVEEHSNKTSFSKSVSDISKSYFDAGHL